MKFTGISLRLCAVILVIIAISVANVLAQTAPEHKYYTMAALDYKAVRPAVAERLPAQFLQDPSTASSPNTSDPSDPAAPIQLDDQSQQRIVDTNKFPEKPSLPARILLWPFNALAPKADAAASFFERRFFNRAKKPNTGFKISPLFGMRRFSDSPGLNGGVLISTGDSISKNFSLFTRAQISTRKYMSTGFGFQLDPTGGEHKVYNLNFETRYTVMPRENFWGLGPNSLRGQRTSYNLQERGLNLNFTAQVTRHLLLGAGVDYSSNRVFPGESDSIAQIDEVFSNLPGMNLGAALLGTSIFAEYDHRDQRLYPRSGFFLRLHATSNDSVGREDFGYFNYRFDTRGYIPLGTKRRVLALRLIGNFNEEKGGSQIPFFRLARLGTRETLRGYDPDRFFGRNALAANIEYRFEIGRFLDTIAFTDLGQVYNRRSEFNTRNIHVTFGGGFQFKNEKRAIANILVGKSGEGLRVILTFGPTF